MSKSIREAAKCISHKYQLKSLFPKQVALKEIAQSQRGSSKALKAHQALIRAFKPYEGGAVSSNA